jgi:hypothetical protein
MAYSWTANVTDNPGVAITWASDSDTWATVPYTWANATNNSWVLSGAEGWNNAELEYENFTKYKFLEGWTNTESNSHTWAEFLKVIEGWTNAELAGRSYSPYRWAEGWTNSESSYRNPNKISAEGWTTSDNKLANTLKSILEHWTNTELEYQIYAHQNNESWNTTDIIAKFNLIKLLVESFHTIEMWTDLSQYHLNIPETWRNAELEKESYNKSAFLEGWHTSDSNTKNFVKDFIEQWTNSEAFNKNWSSQLSILEALGIVDVLSMQYNVSVAEAWHNVDSLLRRANAVISDLVITNTDLNSSNFNNVLSPAGYTAFENIVTGDYTYQNAIVKVVLQSGLTSEMPNVNEWQLNIDVPNISDSGLAHLTTNQPLTIPFNSSFHAPPEISIIPVGLTDSNGIVIIDSVSAENFVVELKDGNMSLDGYVSWSAKGY